jgi:hypothetical protein
VADLANLRIAVDSRDVASASQDLNKMGAAASGAEGSVRSFGATATRTSVAVNGMNAVIAQGAAAQTAAANAMRAVGQTGQLAGHQITNLAYQFQDLGVQIASGQNPLVAFVQQGSQISGVMMQSGMSTKQFGAALLTTIGILKTTSDAQLDAAAASTGATASRFRALNTQAAEAVIAAQAELALAAAQAENATTALAAQAATERRAAGQARLAAAQIEAAATAKVLSAAEMQAAAASTAAGAATAVAFAPVTAIILGVVAAAATLAAGFTLISGQFDKSGEVEAYAKAMGMTSEQIEKAGGASVTTMDTIKGLWMTMYEGLNLGAVFDTIKGWLDEAGKFAVTSAKIIYAAFAGTFNAVKVIWATFPAVLSDLFVQAVNAAIGAVGFLVNNIVAAINDLAGEPLLSPVKFAQIANENAGAAQKAGQAIGKAYTDAYSDAGAFMSKWEANSIKVAKGRLDEERKQKKAAAEKKSEEQKLFEQREKQAKQFLENTEKETSRIGKTAIEIKKLEIAAAAAAAPTALLGLKILAAGAAWEEATRNQAGKDFQNNIIKPLQNELALVGLTGEARARRALELQEEAFKAKAAADGIKDVNAAWQEYLKAETDIINAESVFDKRQKEAEKLKETIAGLIDLTDELFGGAGSFLANLGKEINIVAPDLKKDLKAIFDDLPKDLQDTFKDFGGSLATILANAKIGQMVGGGAGGAVGGAVGGALGKQFLTKGLQDIGGKVFGKALGSLAGPLGSIAGGLLGGLVGGLLTKTKTGSVTLTQIAGGAMQRTLTGNSAQLKGIADNMANGLLKGLGNVAEQLGGTLGGNVKVSLGMRKKDYVVDPTGAGRTKGSGVKNFGTDEAAAVAYITQLAIQQGIVTGISAGAQTLIRAGNDLNEQVQKALKFDQVFKDLKSQSDPLQSSLDELSVEMEKLKVIFGEAGASAADYAKLEELYAIKQAKAIFEANRPRRELEIQLMEAQGDAAGALAAQRALELESMDANLRGLQEQVYTAQDAAKATQALADAQEKAAEEAAVLAEAALALARDRRMLEIDLLEAQGFATDALVARRQLELEAMDETLRGLQKQIWAAEDAKAANDAMNAAASAAAEVAKAAADLQRNRVELEIQLLEALGKSSEALAARRELELAALDETLRGLQLQIYAAEDAKNASNAAAEATKTMAAEQERLAEQTLALSRERRSMEIDLLEAQGFAVEALAARRAVEVETIDASLRGLQLQIYAAQDAKAANDAAAEAARAAAEEQARAAEQILAIAKERRSLEIELLDAQGFAVEALAARRAMELETIDATLVGLKQQIWAAQAKAEADAVAAKAAEDAAKIQEKAAEDAAQAMQKYAETLANVSQTVVDEINRLRGINASSSSVLLKAQFATLTAQARTGNLDALGKLPELSRSIEEATLGSATSALEVARIRAWLSASLTETLGAQAANSAEIATTGAGSVFDGNQTSMASNSAQTADGIANMRNEMYNALYQVAKNTGKSFELMDRWDGDGLPDIREDASDYY